MRILRRAASLSEFTSLSGPEAAGSGEAVPTIGLEGLRILPRVVIFSLDPRAFYFKKIKYVGGHWDLIRQSH